MSTKVMAPAQEQVTLTVNGRGIPLSDFVQRAMAGMLRGFLGSLKGVHDPGEVCITLSRPQQPRAG
ncbi:hypothetical protein DYH09_00555 [bacterium CPR1]|nr:hypothetical protein [bacterium CPR1]